MTMTKKEAIKYRINTMDDIDLIHLISEINSYDGGYNCFYSMDEFNDIYCDVSPIQIADEVADAGDNFSADNDFFYYNEIGIICSCDEMTAADMIRTNCMDSLVDDFMNMRNCEAVADCDDALWDIITADDDATFDDEGYEILK